MASPKIKFKRSAVAGKRPTLNNLELGEIALNTFDGKLFSIQDTGGVGIATTVYTINPWNENFGGSAISYSGNVNIAGVTTLGIVTGATSVQATKFYGDGSSLTGINAGAGGTENVSSNTITAGIITATSEFYPPTLTTAQRDAISFNNGAMIFNTDEQKVQVYIINSWKTLAFELDPYTVVGL